MKFPILHRFTDETICEIELDASYENEPRSVQLGAAVKTASSKNINLTGANLTGADIAYANLANANLAGQGLLQINGLRWPVLVTPEYLKIGCEQHSHDYWRSFDDRRILQMAGKNAAEFWADNKTWLLERCEWAAGFRKRGAT